MDIKQLFTDEKAVSPVIGVILMVAITVILAAVIGSFVLNLGGSLQQSAPQASFDFDYDAGGSSDVAITHATGDSITASETSTLQVTDGSNPDNWTTDLNGDFPVSAGDSVTYENVDSDEPIRVVWNSANGENSATLSQSTAP